MKNKLAMIGTAKRQSGGMVIALEGDGGKIRLECKKPTADGQLSCTVTESWQSPMRSVLYHRTVVFRR